MLPKGAPSAHVARSGVRPGSPGGPRTRGAAGRSWITRRGAPPERAPLRAVGARRAAPPERTPLRTVGARRPAPSGPAAPTPDPSSKEIVKAASHGHQGAAAGRHPDEYSVTGVHRLGEPRGVSDGR